MVPAHFVFLDAMPLTPNGKIDRRALPAPDTNRSEQGYVAPRTVTEEALARIWAEVLKLDRVGVHDNFFEIGGHSLAMLQLTQQIERRLGMSIPPAALYQSQSVASLVHSLTQVYRQHAVLLRNGAGGPPIFFVHPVGGGVSCYRVLATQINESSPIYGLQSLTVTDRDIKPSTLDEICYTYIADILSIQPTGPFLLAGWSLGGVLAQHIGYLLEQAGHEVRWVALFDSSNRGADREHEPQFSLAAYLEMISTMSTNTVRDTYGIELAMLHQKLLEFTKMTSFSEMASLLTSDSRALNEFGFELSAQRLLLDLYNATNANRILTIGHMPKRTRAALYVFWATETISSGMDPTFWSSFTGQSEYSTVPGTHQDVIFGEAGRIISSKINELL
jgi:thioesterase domain-containing protein/acyl carrier protein